MRKFLILVPLLFSGCTPYCYRACPYTLAQTDLTENVQQAFNSSTICPGVYPNEEWWLMFEDPQLTECIEASLVCHPDIKTAEAKIRRACYDAKEARSALFPHLYFIGSVVRNDVSEFSSLFPGELGVITETTLVFTNLLYELDIWGKNRALYYSALDEVQAQIADYEEAKLLLSTSIASVYFDLQVQLARLELTKERLQAREDLYQLLYQQFEFGIISEYRLYETDTEVEQLRDLVLQLEALVEIDRHALAALVENISCVRICQAPAGKLETPFPLPACLPSDLLLRRPDITAQKWRVEASCFDVRVAKTNFFPSIDLIGLIGLQSFEIEELFTRKARWLLGQALGLFPIFTAGKLKAELGVARENLEIAVEMYNQTVLTAVQQVSDALTNLVKSDERHRALQASVEDARDLFDLTNQRFVNGIANRISVLNAVENVLFQTDLELQVQLVRYTSAVDLIRSIGGGYYECR